MKLSTALTKINSRRSDAVPKWTCGLSCGFTPLHLQTYLHACLLDRTAEHFALEIGLFGDLAGNIERFVQNQCEKQVIVIEWSDLDPRLGYRTTHGWRSQNFADIHSTVAARLKQYYSALASVDSRTSIVASLPSLPLPPIAHNPPVHGSPLELQLRNEVNHFALDLAEFPNVKLLSSQELGMSSPPHQRYDVRSDLSSGFPYHKQHAYTLASGLAELLLPASPMKGIITDLDNTFWKGILGEDGIQGVHWDLDHAALAHGLYQELLQSLADTGILIAVASKNDVSLVEQAFHREELVFHASQFFPIEAHWEPKSNSITRILQNWNIGADSVVFIDDSPMEIAEVQSSHPDMDCCLFPAGDDRAILALLWELRRKFGKTNISEEDRIRAQSLKAAKVRRAESQGVDQDEFLAKSEAQLLFEFGDDDKRTLELINKTNQFNLNGRRYDESDWRDRLSRDDSFLVSVNYQDKFGPLGKIAVAVGTISEHPTLDTLVMSCRAFSRRIEYQLLQVIFEQLECDQMTFAFEPTDRNGPVKSFLEAISGQAVSGTLTVQRETFVRRCLSTFGTCTIHDQ